MNQNLSAPSGAVLTTNPDGTVNITVHGMNLGDFPESKIIELMVKMPHLGIRIGK